MKQVITRAILIQKGLIKPVDKEDEKKASFARAIAARRKDLDMKPLVSVKVVA